MECTGADSVEMRGDTLLVHASDSDAVARYLLNYTPARDIEITARNLEDAFLALTSGTDEPASEVGRTTAAHPSASAATVPEGSLR